MCIFMDTFKKEGRYIFPSVRVVFEGSTEKVYSFVEYVYVGDDHITITRVGPDIHEDVTLDNVEFFCVINE